MKSNGRVRWVLHGPEAVAELKVFQLEQPFLKPDEFSTAPRPWPN